MDVRRELIDLSMKFQNAAEKAKSHQLEMKEAEEAGKLAEGYSEYWTGVMNAYSLAKNDLRDFIWRLQRYGY